MKENFRATLRVNEKVMEMNAFVEEFLSRTMLGAVSSLKGTEEIKNLKVHQKKGNVEITVNGKDIPLTAFPNDIISNMLVGIVSSLKDVDDVDSMDISVEVV
jgi:predicted PilT family ATPase